MLLTEPEEHLYMELLCASVNLPLLGQGLFLMVILRQQEVEGLCDYWTHWRDLLVKLYTSHLHLDDRNKSQ